MPTQIITLGDDIRVEAEVTEGSYASVGEKVQQTIDSIRPTLRKVIKPVADTWAELSRSMRIQQAEIEIGFGFEASGNVFVAGSKGNVNLKVKLVVTHVAAEP